MNKSMGAIFFVSVLAFSSNILMGAISSMAIAPLKTTKGDDPVSGVVSSFNNKKVTYENGKVLIMADPSKFIMSVLSIGSVGGLSLATLLGIAAFQKCGYNVEDAKSLGAFAAVFAFLGVYSTYKLWPHAERFLAKTPYIILDETGIFEWGKLMLAWDEFERFECRSVGVDGSVINELHFIKKDGSSAFETSDDVEHDFLPIHQGQLIRLATEVMAKRGASLYMKAAEQGDVEAQLNLGLRYERGNGIGQDWGKAAYWYEVAAQKSLAEAEGRLGMCYEAGNGVEKDISKAIYWYTKAAEQNFAQAQFLLGVCYEKVQGVDQNLQQAVVWYTKAAEQSGKNEGIICAQYNLGRCYEFGKGVGENPEQAMYWYTKAAQPWASFEQGYPGANDAIERLKQKKSNI
ncbi:MAG: tetratricopeptide repeat protein [Candidatus Babeliales bacterium]